MIINLIYQLVYIYDYISAGAQAAILAQIEQLDQEDAQLLLQKMLVAVGSVLRSNVFLEDRFALTMRVEPGVYIARITQEVTSTERKCVGAFRTN